MDVPDTVETFMGKLVHEVLEKLYKDLQFHKMNSKEELLMMFEKIWKEKWSDSIVSPPFLMRISKEAEWLNLWQHLEAYI